MQSKRLITLLMFVGGAIGGYVPLLWGAGYFSLTSILFNAVGAVVGIYVGFKLSR
jgi:hypothetical protein